MSIRAEIKRQIHRLVRARKLVSLPRLYLNDRRIRCMLLTQGVAQDVISPSGGMPDDERLAQFRGNLDAFAVGEAITIARHPFEKPSDADLAPIHPVSSHVWDFRILEPPNGIRCLGFFAAKDVFIALSWDYREDVEPVDWSRLVEESKTIWDDLFSPIFPHFGDFPDAYISKPFTVV
jgi:hypothetical protein